MDDLLGEDWQKPSKPASSSNNIPPLNPAPFASNYSSFRASPALSQSGTASPQNISRPSSTLNGAPKPAAASGDQFGNLLSLKSQKASAAQNVSIQERQKQLLEEKRRQQEQQAAMWDTLGSGRGTPEIRGSSPAISQQGQGEDVDDILAAFNKAAPVDRASHFPPPVSSAVSGTSTPAQRVQSNPSQAETFNDDDDDPFGLGALPKKSNGHVGQPPPQSNDDDDILGDLGKPVSERPLPTKPTPAPTPAQEPETTFVPGGGEDSEDDAPKDRAVAELVDMGFPADNAKIALAENGGDVQSAVGWLLQQAHEESKQKAKGESAERRRSPANNNRSPQRGQRADQDNMPSWMRQEGRSNSTQRRTDSQSPAGGERDAAQVAQEYGTKFLKGASSLWKASQKQMAKTMAEFQQERDPSQPKWMQDAGAVDSKPAPQRRQDDKPRAPTRQELDLTNEAALLDAPRERPQKPPRPTASDRPHDLHSMDAAPAEPLPRRPVTQPKFMQQQPPAQDKRPATKLSRQEVEDQSAQAYVSPARRKKAAPPPDASREPEVDLFSSAPKPTAAPAPARAAQPAPASRPSPAPSKPKAPPRSIPSISPSALSSSATHRKAGGEAFKRGDFASAHEAYTAALTPLPSTHPIAIIVLTNRALTGIKTGDAKSAVSDSDRALSIIGESQGTNETIDLGGGEGIKDMREFYGKALMRKAEALEHMEKWTDAANMWRTAVEAGVGGAISARGRDRCEKAAAPKPVAAKPAPAKNISSAPSKAPPARGLGNSMQRASLSNASSGEAVKKLRAANAAAEKADDEKFALADQVDARLTAWRGGKTDNLRALLQSLDNVLWEGAGWKKVGMSDLVMPNKVKIIYMKAIAKVHPDKIPHDATTEQQMVSAAVFSTLNEAWDKFKKDNNL